jgi:hypothetical protein
MMKMRDQGSLIGEKVDQLKEKYQNAKRKGESKQVLDKIKVRYKHQRKTHRIYNAECKQLKKEIGYDSPQSSDSLLSGNDDASSYSDDD